MVVCVFEGRQLATELVCCAHYELTNQYRAGNPLKISKRDQ